MPEKQKKTIRELTLMLMYLTSWEERDTPEMRAVKKKELEKYPLVRRCWKGYDHDLLDKLVPFPVSWTVKMKKKQKETQDILSYHSQAAGCSDKARAKASGGRQPIEECGRTGL